MKTLKQILEETKHLEAKVFQNCTDPFQCSLSYRENEKFETAGEYHQPQDYGASFVYDIFGSWKPARISRFTNEKCTLYLLHEWL